MEQGFFDWMSWYSWMYFLLFYFSFDSIWIVIVIHSGNDNDEELRIIVLFSCRKWKCILNYFKILNYLSTELEISVKWIKVNWSVEIRIHETEKYEIFRKKRINNGFGIDYITKYSILFYCLYLLTFFNIIMLMKIWIESFN